MKHAAPRLRLAGLATTVAILAATLPSQAAAQFAFYTDQSAWAAAVGTYTVEDFSDFPPAGPLSSVTTDNGTFSGGAGYDEVVRGGADTHLFFSTGIGAFGGFWDLTPAGEGQGLEFTIHPATSTGTVVVPQEVPNSYAGDFWGFTSPTEFTQLDIQGGTQGGSAETYSADDLHFSTTVTSTEVVPEPATLLLLASGLAGVGLMAVGRRRNQETL
jgi:hypothetical protein